MPKLSQFILDQIDPLSSRFTSRMPYITASVNAYRRAKLFLLENDNELHPETNVPLLLRQMETASPAEIPALRELADKLSGDSAQAIKFNTENQYRVLCADANRANQDLLAFDLNIFAGLRDAAIADEVALFA